MAQRMVAQRVEQSQALAQWMVVAQRVEQSQALAQWMVAAQRVGPPLREPARQRPRAELRSRAPSGRDPP
jgi:hypothetical protein